MIRPGTGSRIWLVAGVTDMRKGFDGLATVVQTQIRADPLSGHLFVFRGRRGDRIKVLWWDGDGLCLYAKRLERGDDAGLAFKIGAHRREHSDPANRQTGQADQHQK